VKPDVATRQGARFLPYGLVDGLELARIKRSAQKGERLILIVYNRKRAPYTYVYTQHLQGIKEVWLYLIATDNASLFHSEIFT
jgi:hypothetical protein